MAQDKWVKLEDAGTLVYINLLDVEYLFNEKEVQYYYVALKNRQEPLYLTKDNFNELVRLVLEEKTYPKSPEVKQVLKG